MLKSLKLYFIAVAIYCCATPCGAGTAGSPHLVLINQAVQIELSDASQSVVLADPDIADIVSHTDSVIVVIGKKMGETNLLVRDHDHHILNDIVIRVVPNSNHALSVYAGSSRADYLCLDQCRPLSGAGADPHPPASLSANVSASK